MPKLFVALDLPVAATATLASLQPSPGAGIRLTRQDQMHLTLHFLGEAELERTAAVLQSVSVPSFSMRFDKVGQFPSAGGTVTLWVGVQKSDRLLELHAAVALALAGEGFRPEARPYAAHITLARCEPGTPARIVEEFLATHGPVEDVPVEQFSLYSSALREGAPVYRRERSFVLHS